MRLDAAGFVVQPRFCGPPRSGNGGYVVGRLAAFMPAPDSGVEVTLRTPPPIGVPLYVSDDMSDGERPDDGGRLILASDRALVAEATKAEPGAFAAPPPAPVDFDEAVEAAVRYAGRRIHPFPTCFVCGPDRARGDGMRLQPGSVGPERVAAAWQPHASLGGQAQTNSAVPAEFVWAALDCPGGWAAGVGGRPMVLGRITAKIFGVPEVGQSCVIVGQVRDSDESNRSDRKALASSALYSKEGLLARAEQVWIVVDPSKVQPA